MKKFIDKLMAAVRTSLGRPALIENWAAQVSASQKHPARLTSDSIHTADVVRWDRFGEDNRAPGLTGQKGTVQGWVRGPGGSYESTQLACPALKNLLVETTTERWACDLQDVQGLASSKSDLGRFATMEAFATQDCAGLMEHPSPEALNENLHWNEVRIHDPNGPDHFCRYDWDGRLFMVNHGGSHHFAAAHQMAKDLGQDVPLSGRLKTYGLNLQAVSTLRDQFEMFAIPKDPVLKNEFWDGMKAMGASHFSLALPGPERQAMETVLLPRNDAAALRVAAVLRREGFWDVGQSLQDLALGVHRHALSQLPPVAPTPPLNLPPTLSQACRRLEAPRPEAPGLSPDRPVLEPRRQVRTP